MTAQLKELIDGADALSKDKRAELRGVISTRPGLKRYLRVTPGGLLRIDAGKAKTELRKPGGNKSSRERTARAGGMPRRIPYSPSTASWDGSRHGTCFST